LKNRKILFVLVIILLLITSVSGILSWNTASSYWVENQYGDKVLMYGYGIYARDSFFRAPIFIGTDLCILLLVIPSLIYSFYKYLKDECDVNRLKLMSLFGVSAYYAASLSFGVVYNRLALVYIILFGLSIYGAFYYGMNLKIKSFNNTKGINIFLILSGLALFIAWLPDMIPTIIKDTTLPLIEVYTTEITYVLDIGIISPMCIICLLQLKRKNQLGTILLAFILRICFVVGVMMVSQTAFQILSKVEMSFIVLLTKSISFLLLGGFAFVFQKKLYKEIRR